MRLSSSVHNFPLAINKPFLAWKSFYICDLSLSLKVGMEPPPLLEEGFLLSSCEFIFDFSWIENSLTETGHRMPGKIMLISIGFSAPWFSLPNPGL